MKIEIDFKVSDQDAKKIFSDFFNEVNMGNNNDATHKILDLIKQSKIAIQSLSHSDHGITLLAYPPIKSPSVSV